MIKHASPAFTQHGAIQIAQNHPTARAYLTRQTQSDIAAASRNIQNPASFACLYLCQHTSFPQAMGTEAHQVIHQVIFVCDGGKYTHYLVGFFMVGDSLETEMSGFVHAAIVSGDPLLSNSAFVNNPG